MRQAEDVKRCQGKGVKVGSARDSDRMYTQAMLNKIFKTKMRCACQVHCMACSRNLFCLLGEKVP